MKIKLISKLSGTPAAFFSLLTGIFHSLVVGPPALRPQGVFKGRMRTCDVAFTYRMGAGFPGDVNRTNPFSVVPGLINTTNPPAAYGNPVLVNSADNTYRGVIVGDGSATAGPIAGVMVRPYPSQQSSGGMSASLGTATPPTSGVGDFLRQGFIMAKLPAGAVVVKGGTVYVRAAATSGAAIQGGLVAAADGTNNYIVTNARITGPADANGNVEIEVWPA